MQKKKQNIEKIFFTIGEVADMIKVSPSTIRYWESNFNELDLKKSAGGTRMFTKDDIELLKFINYLIKERGLTVKGAQQKLKYSRKDSENTWEIVSRLKEIRETLVDIKNELEET